jgi:hypothetical protein
MRPLADDELAHCSGGLEAQPQESPDLKMARLLAELHERLVRETTDLLCGLSGNC